MGLVFGGFCMMATERLTAQTQGPLVGLGIRTTWESSGNQLQAMPQAAEIEGEAGKYTGGILKYRVELAAAPSPITVDVVAFPGASLAQIRDNLLAGETAAAHHDIVIFEGGKNDALNADSALNLRTIYRNIITAVSLRTDALATSLFVQEVEPIIVEVLNERGFNGTRYENNILAINEELAGLDFTRNLEVIATYDKFKPHYSNTDPLSWCLNPANSGGLDGSHLSAYGTPALGKAWWDAIAATVLANGERPVRVAVYGDSIAAAAYLPAEQRPAAWLVHYAVEAATGVEEWVCYR